MNIKKLLLYLAFLLVSSSLYGQVNKSFDTGSNTFWPVNFPQLGASTGNVIKWNGSAWAPGTDAGALSGTANTIPFYNTTTSLASTAVYWDNTNLKFGINTGGAPTAFLDVNAASYSNGNALFQVRSGSDNRFTVVGYNNTVTDILMGGTAYGTPYIRFWPAVANTTTGRFDFNADLMVFSAPAQGSYFTGQLVMSRLGDATSGAVQYGTSSYGFQTSMWNGSAAVQRNYRWIAEPISSGVSNLNLYTQILAGTDFLALSVKSENGFIGIGGVSAGSRVEILDAITTGSTLRIGGNGYTSTSLAKSIIKLDDSYAAASGSGSIKYIDIVPTITLSGTASAAQYGIDIHPTLSFSSSNDPSFIGLNLNYNSASALGIVQTGSSVNNKFVGKTAFGGTSSASEAVEILSTAFIKISGGLKDYTGSAGTPGYFLKYDGTGVIWSPLSGSGVGDVLNNGNSFGTPGMTIGTNDAFSLNLETNNIVRATITGASSTGGAWTYNDITSNTSTLEALATYNTNSSGTPANGFGIRVLYNLESSTTNDRNAAAIDVLWSNSVDASRTANLVFSLANAGAIAEVARFTPSTLTTATGFTLGNSAQSLTLSSTSASSPITLTQTTANQGVLINTASVTSSQRDIFVLGDNVTASTGSAATTAISISGTLNLTGTATATQRGILINPTFTSLNATGGYRAIDIGGSNASAFGIYQSGSATFNIFAGRTTFGTTTNGTGWINFAANTTTVPLMQFVSGTFLSTPLAYVLEQDASRLAHTNNTNLREVISGVTFTATADNTLTSSNTETSILPTGVGNGKLLPTNYFVAGKTIRIRGGGVYSTPATATTMTLKIKYNTVVIATIILSLDPSSASNEFRFESNITCRTTGASGTVISEGFAEYYTLTGIVRKPLNNGGATQTLDTTASATLDVTGTWDANNANRILKTTFASIEILN